jgi:hypothetical protein
VKMRHEKGGMTVDPPKRADVKCLHVLWRVTDKRIWTGSDVKGERERERTCGSKLHCST